MASASITKTDDGNNVELLERLKAALTSRQQQLFVDSFWTTLQCDEERDMVMDLDAVCEFIGMRKDNAKRTLKAQFKNGEHYEMFAPQIEEQNRGRGGHNTERIRMTPDTFKELCMLCSTAKGREVRGYYIKMEKVLKAYLKDKLAQQTAENQRMLEERNAAESRLEAELEKQKERKYIEVPKVDNTYVAMEGAELGTGRHKVGKTLDKKSRTSSFNTANARGMKMIHVRETHNGPLVEDIVADVMKRYHYQREHYMCNVEHTVNVIDVAATVVDTLASCYDSMSRDEMFDKVIENLEEVRTEKALEEEEDDEEDEEAAEDKTTFSSQEDVVTAICEKLGVKDAVDCETEIRRSVIDGGKGEEQRARLKEWTVIVRAGQKLFGMPVNKKGEVLDFRAVRYGIDSILRRWSGVSLKDATDGKRTSKGRVDRGARAEVLRLHPGTFASLLVRENVGRPSAS